MRGAKRRFGISLVAVLAGNLIYYSVQRYLPVALQHQIFRVDLGLGLDFAICAACYVVASRIW